MKLGNERGHFSQFLLEDLQLIFTTTFPENAKLAGLFLDNVRIHFECAGARVSELILEVVETSVESLEFTSACQLSDGTLTRRGNTYRAPGSFATAAWPEGPAAVSSEPRDSTLMGRELGLELMMPMPMPKVVVAGSVRWID